LLLGNFKLHDGVVAGAIICATAAIVLPRHLTVCAFGVVLHTKFLWLCLALALWGLGQGAGPLSEALLADSTHTGDWHTGNWKLRIHSTLPNKAH